MWGYRSTSLILLSVLCSVKSETITASIGNTKIINSRTTDNTYTYRWGEGGLNSYTWLYNNLKLSGVNSKSLTIQNIASSDASYYRCVVDERVGIPFRIETFTLVVYGEWISWTVCGGSCGQGVRQRNRLCYKPSQSNGEDVCTESMVQSQPCNVEECPVNGEWSVWSSYGSCSVTCGYGTTRRTRQCNNPVPSNGGQGCPGSNTENLTCGSANCPVNGMWSTWATTGICSVSCGEGTITKHRQCNSPWPSNGGQNCQGIDTDHSICRDKNCPIDGEWASWTEWSHCTITCGGGNKTRERNCTDPSPLYGGQSCSGLKLENDICSTHDCPVTNGNWGEWSSWNGCSKICRTGILTRTRQCNNPAPSGGGITCIGNYIETKNCSTGKDCPDSLTSDGDSHGVVIGGSVAAVVLVSIVVVIVTVLLKRKRFAEGRSKRSYTNEHVKQSGINIILTPEPNYQDNTYLKVDQVAALTSTGNDYDELHAYKDDIREKDPDNVYCDIVLDDCPEYENK